MSFSETEYVGVHPVSAIFVDIPNVINLGADAGRLTVAWPLLARAILRNKDLKGTELTSAGAYSPILSEARLVAEALNGTLQSNLKSAARAESRIRVDIDSLIINDIWGSVAGHFTQSMRFGHLWLPLRVRHILVSGDGGYLRAYQSLAEKYEDNLERELIVYSWREKLHRDLLQVANKIHYLDDIPGLVSINQEAT